MLDAVRAFEEGVGTIEAIDAGFRLGAGHPMGPLTLNDFVGLETLSRAARGHVRGVPRPALRDAAAAAQDDHRGLVREEDRPGLLRLVRAPSRCPNPKIDLLRTV